MLKKLRCWKIPRALLLTMHAGPVLSNMLLYTAPGQIKTKKLQQVNNKSRYSCTDGFQTLWNTVLARSMRCLHHSFNCVRPQFFKERWNSLQAARSCVGPDETVPHVMHFIRGMKPWLPANARDDVPWPFLLWRAHLRAVRELEGLERFWTAT